VDVFGGDYAQFLSIFRIFEFVAYKYLTKTFEHLIMASLVYSVNIDFGTGSNALSINKTL
jgi:hypothetical protein